MSALKEGKDTLQFIQRLPWEKMLIWFVFLLCIYLLRSFFGILFITFVISYIASNIVRWICSKINLPSRETRLRWLVTGIVFVLFLSLMFGAGNYVFPRIVDQVKGFVTSVQVLLPVPVRKALYGNEMAVPGQQIPAQPTLIDYAENLMEKILGDERFTELKASAEYQVALDKMTENLKRWIVREFPRNLQADSPDRIVFWSKGSVTCSSRSCSASSLFCSCRPLKPVFPALKTAGSPGSTKKSYRTSSGSARASAGRFKPRP